VVKRYEYVIISQTNFLANEKNSIWLHKVYCFLYVPNT
jgi:hypothetical protein